MPLVCVFWKLSESLQKWSKPGGSPSNAHMQGYVTCMRTQLGEDAFKLHLEECYSLANDDRGMVF